mgnify:CR=1 FL=1
MKNRKLEAVLLAGAMAVSAFSAVPVFAEETTEAETEAESKNEDTEGKFVLEYPEDMQALGYTEPIVLDEVPERVVSLSAAPVLTLYELGVNLVGIPNSMVVSWPEDLKASTETVSFSVMSPDDFDYESVVDLEPDLVLLGYTGADTAGATLESLGIPVYYLYAGHTVPYESIVGQTNALIDAFAVDEDSIAAGEMIRDRFDTLEQNVEAAREAFDGKTVMVLQSAGTDSHYIQTKNGTLGSMADMIGLTNVFENEGSSMVQLDYEQALDYDPDLVLCVGATSAEEHQKLMETAFAENEEYWNSIPAIADGRVLYLPVSYVSTAGINVVDCINDLIKIVADYYGVEVETQAIEPLLADETEDESDTESDAAEIESAEDEVAAETEETKE